METAEKTPFPSTSKPVAENTSRGKSFPAVPVFQHQKAESVVPIQKKSNNTGLPDQLKSKVENLSGFSMDDVKSH